VLGSTFSWFDLAAVAVGVLVGVFVDKLVFHPPDVSVCRRVSDVSIREIPNP
jgi:hypothetical protein